MCLLDEVAGWDASAIRCIEPQPSRSGQSAARRRPTWRVMRNRIRGAGDGGARRAVGRGRGERPRAGYLASVRDVSAVRARLDELPATSIVDAEQTDGRCRARDLSVRAVGGGDAKSSSGRAAVVLDAGVRECSGMKRALVTGGSGAIGAAICRRLAVAGRHVFVHANTASRRREAARARRSSPPAGRRSAVAFDVTDPRADDVGARSAAHRRRRSRSSSTTPASTMTR